MPSQTITTGPLLSPQKTDGSLSSVSDAAPSSIVSLFLGSADSSLPAVSKNGGASMMVQPRIFLAPYTCCKERSTVHFGEQCPSFSNASCRKRSLWITRTSFSGSSLKSARRCVHAPLGIVQLYCACSDTASPWVSFTSYFPTLSFHASDVDATDTKPRTGHFSSNR